MFNQATIVRLKSDNYDCYVSESAYNEICLQMSTGDHATHRAKVVTVDCDKLNNIQFHSVGSYSSGFVDYLRVEDEFVDGAMAWYCYDGGDCYISFDHE